MTNPTTMSAIEWDAARESLELITVPIPGRPAPGNITVRVSYSGVCGTDLHVVAKEFAAADKVDLLLIYKPALSARLIGLLCNQISNH